MATPLDLDQLQTFCAIADCGSFTEAARRIHKTQSAVSMQIKRLEERLGQVLLSREGRSISLTPEGEEVYSRARRMLRINAEIADIFSEGELAGSIRIGLPDDYAAKLLPLILSGFKKTHPRISVDVSCRASEELLEGMSTGRFDLIVFTQGTLHEFGELFRTEKLVWIASPTFKPVDDEPLPLACGPQCCYWRAGAIDALNRSGKDFRIAYTSANATAIISAVMSDLAIGFLPESALTPGMVILGEEDGMPALNDAQIAMMRASHAYGGIYDALAKHIVSEMGNLGSQNHNIPEAAE